MRPLAPEQQKLVLDSALQLFADHEIGETTLDMLTRAGGVSDGAEVVETGHIRARKPQPLGIAFASRVLAAPAQPLQSRSDGGAHLRLQSRGVKILSGYKKILRKILVVRFKRYNAAVVIR